MNCVSPELLVLLSAVSVSGCDRPVWRQTAAPLLSVSPERMVSISWSSDMLSHDTLCRHQWEILVEKDGERKLVCSDSTVPG